MNRYIVERLSKTGDGLEATCVLLSDTDKRVQSYRTNGTVADLTPKVRASFAATQDVAIDIPLGVEIDATPPTPQPPPKPTPEQVAQAAFLTDWRLYQAKLRGQAGSLPVDQKSLDTLLQSLQAAYLPEYDVFL